MSFITTREDSPYSLHSIFDSIVNFRPLCNDLYSKDACLYRCGFLSNLSDADAVRLQEQGIRVIFDLRESTDEITAQTASRYDIYYRSLPVNNASLGYLIHHPVSENYVRYYRETMISCALEIAQFFHALADFVEAVPLVFGCNLGKDRTGIMAYLLLSVFRANINTIYHDYEISGQYLEGNSLMADFFSSQHKESQLSRYRTSGTVLSSLHRWVLAQYGTPENYLFSIGVDKKNALEDQRNMGEENRILVMNAPHIPSYFNAGHRLGIFEVGAYLQHHTSHTVVDAVDVAALNMTWKELSDCIFSRQYFMIAIMLDYDSADNLPRLLAYIKQLSPNSHIILFGRLCKQIPGFFRRFPIEAIAVSGDDEAAVFCYYAYLTDYLTAPSGCHVFKNGIWKEYSGGELLSPEQWVFPNISQIPYSDYLKLYANDSNKFCGIPGKRELVVHVSRGCPVACSFCDVPRMQGCADRRISAERLFDYSSKAFRDGAFDYVSMYSPIFTLNQKWTEEFCERMILGKTPYKWKCVTTARHLSKPLISAMAEAGCIRISIGVETLATGESANALPACKQHLESQLVEVAKCCRENSIELNCFVMLGMPGTTLSDNCRTIQFLQELDARIRPTVYTDYNQMRETMTQEEITMFNRQLFLCNGGIDEPDRRVLYHIIYGGILKNTVIDQHF